MEAKYYKVGEKFTLKGVELEVVKTKRIDCPSCVFKFFSYECLCHQCTMTDRKDNNSVVFIPTKK